jgi:hypothetical protein
MTRGALALVLLLGLSPAGRGSDVESGPAKATAIPALKVHDCTGHHKDKTVDYAALRKDKVTVYFLLPADKFDRPMNRFMKALDTKVAKDMPGVYMVAVWLTDDAEKTNERLALVQQSVMYEKTALTSFKGKDGPKGWDVNSDAHLTVVVAAKGKVAVRFGYKSVNETDAPAVIKELGGLTRKK